MDLNLNDFSGIYNDESQFMDTSNANINNVFSNNNVPQHVEENKQQQQPQMIGLDDLNFNDNLMNMSRISNHENEMGPNQQNIESIQVQNQVPPIFEQQPVQQPIQPVVQETSTNEWKKPVIQKKKRFGGGTKKPPKAVVEAKAEVVILDQKIDNDDLNIDDIMIDLPLNQNVPLKSQIAPIQQCAFESRTQNNKYARDSPEPQPLFDCLFCVGIHEHLVLQTVKEKNLKYLYGEREKPKKVEIEEDEDYREFERAYSINMLMYSKYQNVVPETRLSITSLKDNNYQIPSLYNTKSLLNNLCIEQSVNVSPMKNTIQKIQNQVRLFQQKAKTEPQQQIKAQNNLSDSSLCNEEMMVSNILENFEDIDPEDQSMFMNLNIRNRRQKILHNMSFDSEQYDIYNPIFTSDEESISSSNSSVSDSQEVGSSGTSQSISSGRSSSSGSPEYDSSSGQSTLSNQLNDRKVPKEMNSRDLDYNSENNNSSLSSIHREIQEAPAEEASVVVQFKNKIQMPGQQIIRNMEKLESGGCQVEDMQDDTVMKQCKSMFRAGGDKTYKSNESFRDKIFEQRQTNLNNELNDLDEKNLLQLEQLNLDSSLRTDFQSTQRKPNLEQLMLNNNVQTNNNEICEVNSFTNSIHHQKKTTGRFNTKALISSSNKSDNKKLQPMGEMQRYEDDSISKIFPGLSKNDDSNINPLSEHFQGMNGGGAAAVGMTTAFGAESIIQPMNVNDNSNNCRDFLMEEIEEVNGSNISHSTPKQGGIDFYNRNIEQSEKYDKLQLVNSDEDEMSQQSENVDNLSPIVKNSSGGGNLPSNHGDTKGLTQKLNRNSSKKGDLIEQNKHHKTQKIQLRKTNTQNFNQYGQMGPKQNFTQLRRSSNASIEQQQKMYYEAAISSSMGQLPVLEDPLQNSDEQKIGENKKTKTTKNQKQSNLKVPKDLTPMKMKAAAAKQVEANSKTSKKQVSKKTTSNNIDKFEKKAVAITGGNQAAVTQKIKQLKLNQNNLQKKAANNAAGNYGMLSKDQKKLMIQLEKKLQDNTGNQKQKETNQKNVRDNYFKVGGSDLQESDEAIPISSLTAMKSKPQASLYSGQNEKGGLHQKRSSTNLKNRSRERSSEIKKGKQSIDHNKYRSSIVEVNAYNQQNPKGAHTQCSSQSVDKNNNMLIPEKKQGSDPKANQVKQQYRLQMGIPSLNLETVVQNQDGNALDVPDQFLSNHGLGHTMNVAQTKNSLNKLVKIKNDIHQASSKNLDLMKMQKPIGDFNGQNPNKFLRQIKYQKLKQVQQQQSLSHPETMPDTKRMLEKSHANVSQEQQKSYLHSSTSQLQNFSLSQVPEEQQLFQNMIKMDGQSLFQGNDQFLQPAQSHRNPGRNTQQKLSISAGKNKQKIDFMKSTANLQKNFSHIQNTETDGENTKHGQTSKLSIEQDIKFLKMSLNNEKKTKVLEKPAKQIMNTVGQHNRQQKGTGLETIAASQGGLQTISDSQTATSQVSNSMRKSRVSSLEMKKKDALNKKSIQKNKSPTKTPSISIQTKYQKPKLEPKSGQISTKSNKNQQRKIQQERTNTEVSDQMELNQDKSQNYKKLILQNNAKILQYQQKSQNQTPKNQQLGFMSKKQTLILDQEGLQQLPMQKASSYQQQFINQLSSQFQTQTNQQIQSKMSGDNIINSNFSSLPLQIQNKESSSSGTQQYFKLSKYHQNQNQVVANQQPNMQYFKTNDNDNNSLDVFMADQDDSGNGSGLGHISSGEQQIGSMTKDKIAQFNSSTANKSNSLFSAAQPKASGSGMLGVTQVGHGSIVALGQTGLGTTGLTGLTTFGAANTTANTNSMITNNKSGIQNTSNQRSMLNNLGDGQDQYQGPTTSNQKSRKKLNQGHRLQKKSSMKVSQDNLDF